MDDFISYKITEKGGSKFVNTSWYKVWITFKNQIQVSTTVRCGMNSLYQMSFLPFSLNHKCYFFIFLCSNAFSTISLFRDLSKQFSCPVDSIKTQSSNWVLKLNLHKILFWSISKQIGFELAFKIIQLAILFSILSYYLLSTCKKTKDFTS